MGNNIRKEIAQLKKDALEVRDNTKKIKQDVAKESARQVYEDLNAIFVACIDKFYADYDPTFYRREGSLYRTYELTNKNGVISRNFGEQYMPQTYKHSHRVSNKYIYEQMFLKGYHGGAHTIDPDKVEQWGEHPDDGIPWYRTPHPSRGVKNPYNRWSDSWENSEGKGSAEQSTSPADDIMEQLEQYENNKASMIGRGASDALDAAWDLVFSRYNLFNNY